MANFMNIKAESRHEVGKQIAKKIRKTGRIPAIIYGGGKESLPISISGEDLKNILKSEMGENTVLKIQRDNIEVNAMLKEIQYDYLSDNVIHVDFLRIDLTKPVTVSIPVVVEGDPVGVRLEDGVFDFINRELRVQCLADRIPHQFVVDVTELGSGQSIKASVLELEEGVKLISDPGTVICAVTSKKVVVEEEIAEEEEEAVEGEAAEEGKEEGEKSEEDKDKDQDKEETKE